MKVILSFLITFFCLEVQSASFSPSLMISAEGETDRNDERAFVSMENELRLDFGIFEFDYFNLGLTTLYTVEFESAEEPVARWNSVGPQVETSFDFYENFFYGSYSFNLIQDNLLEDRYKVDGFHRLELELARFITPIWKLSFGGEYTHYEGGIPRVYSTPHNSFGVFIDNELILNWLSVGTTVEWRQEAVIRENMKVNTVYDQVLLIPYLKKRFSEVEVSVFTLLAPFRRNYKNVWAVDTFKEANYGLSVSMFLE